jgi:hypothetical protein
MWVPETTVGVQTPLSVTYSESVCSISYPERNAHAPYYIIISGQPDYHIFPHYFINGTTFGKKVTEHKICVLIFSITYPKYFSF